jgi:hypothetical protein
MQKSTTEIEREPIFGTPHPRTFTPLLTAAESALESGELKPANGWMNRKARRHYSAEYIEPEVDQANFRAWLEITLPRRLQGGAFFFFLDPGAWPKIGDEESRTERPLDVRERNTLLRIIRALEAMAKLPARGATSPVEMQLQTMGFSNPKEATIRKVLEEARALEPDSKPQ